MRVVGRKLLVGVANPVDWWLQPTPLEGWKSGVVAGKSELYDTTAHL